jgi:hypothetical protein
LALILADTDVLIDYLAGVQPTTGQVRDCIEADRLRYIAQPNSRQGRIES